VNKGAGTTAAKSAAGARRSGRSLRRRGMGKGELVELIKLVELVSW
jgi:hypothetical protein